MTSAATTIPIEAVDPASDSILDFNPRLDNTISAGSLAFGADRYATGWHRHTLHQIEYAVRGVVEVETETAHYLLPGHRALWIPAGVVHRTVLKDVQTVSVFFDTSLFASQDSRAKVIAIPRLLQEMIAYSERWPIERTSTDSTADSYLSALAGLLAERLQDEQPYSLPTSTDPLISAVMAHTQDHLADISVQGLCRAVSISERTLRRRFPAATGITWRQYLWQSRLLKAMALLDDPERTVADVASRVGFESASSFARAFLQFTGDTPTEYRRSLAEEPPQAHS